METLRFHYADGRTRDVTADFPRPLRVWYLADEVELDIATVGGLRGVLPEIPKHTFEPRGDAYFEIGMMKRWWLSFVDAKRPEGERFLGVCIVEAANEIAALKAAWAIGCNPGGDVQSMPIDETSAVRLSFGLAEFSGRLLGPDEAKRLADRIAAELGS